MKILLGMPSPDSWGGPISSEPPFARALRELGHNVREEVYVYGDKEKPTPFLQRIQRVLKTAFHFRRVLNEEKFDIIHLNTALDVRTLLRDTISIAVMRPRGAKVFLKIHGSDTSTLTSSNPFLVLLRRFLAKQVDAFGVHSKEELENFIAAGFNSKYFHFVKNVISISDAKPKFIEKRESFRLLFVSRFIPAKGLIETIKAIEILGKSCYKFKLICVGDGETKLEGEKLVHDLGLENLVEFTGYVTENEVTEFFHNSDIFVFPTRHIEGFPNVLFKAVVAGLPIVTTRIRAACDYLAHETNCLYTSQTPSDIATNLAKLLSNSELMRKMNKNNLAFKERLSSETVAREYLKIFEDLLDSDERLPRDSE